MKNVWLVGTSAICVDHFKVLEQFKDNWEITVIGRGEANAIEFEKETGKKPYVGGLDKFLSSEKYSIPDKVIVATGVTVLAEVTTKLLEIGVKQILIEKPGAANLTELAALDKMAEQKQAQLFVAYNRRMYDSVAGLKAIAKEDGGVLSCHFEFTEWAHVIETLDIPENELRGWIYGNSTHVIDTVFNIIGIPQSLHTSATRSLDWHPLGSVFVGMGTSVNNVPFTYHSNWESAGRWSIYVMTAKRKLILEPMEILQQQLRGKLDREKVELDTNFDLDYKAGFYRQIDKFLHSDFDDLCTVKEQITNYGIYKQIANDKS